ncbi:MAG: peptidoglycan DD-metalloendopeptidase family protein [Clostridia bacterium]|nr:peptidoglycan DD-metalloendopeptidase family protein [Clostridia bacterium]
MKKFFIFFLSISLFSIFAVCSAVVASATSFDPAWPSDSFKVNCIYYYFHEKETTPTNRHATTNGKYYDKAIDIGGSSGSNIYAVESGTVSYVGWDSAGFGNYLHIEHKIGDTTYTTKYAHLSSIRVSKGQTVKRGEVIGYMGSTGAASTGTHLHFECWNVDVWDTYWKEQYKDKIEYIWWCYRNNSQLNYNNYDSKSVNFINWLNSYYKEDSDGYYRYTGPDICTCSTSYAGQYRCTTSSSDLRIRSTHSTGGTVVGYIPSGATVTVTKGNGTWAHVTYNGISGLASMEYLEKIEDDINIGAVAFFSEYDSDFDLARSESISNGTTQKLYYFWYRFWDYDSNDWFYSFGGKDYTVKISGTYSNGEKIFEPITYKNSDVNWIRFIPQKADTYTIRVDLTIGDQWIGFFEKSIDIKYTVSFTASPGNVTLNLDGNNTANVKLKIIGGYPGGWLDVSTIQYDDSIFGITEFAWESDSVISMTVKGLKPGTGTFKFYMKEPYTGNKNTVATAILTVNVVTSHTHSYGSWYKYDSSYHAKKCSCGDIQKSAHTWNSGVITKAATCTATGTKTYTCTTSGCGATKTETIAVIGHSWNEGYVSRKPTCIQTGNLTKTCKTCGTAKDFNIVINPDAHKWDYGTVTKVATCTSTGVRTYRCINMCGTVGCTVTKTEQIPAEAHSYGSWCEMDDNYHYRYCACGARDAERHSVASDDLRYENNHPHKEYRRCVCGTVYFTGGTTKVSDCAECYPITGVALNKTSATIVVGENLTLTAIYVTSNINIKYDFVWTSSNSNVASVTSNGVVTGKSEGTATIMVKTVDGSKTATCIITIKARTYTVTYNANGGTGAPAAQTKTNGVNLMLSIAKPTRSGYTFKGWATSASGGVAYGRGAVYKTDASVTLYAVWELVGGFKLGDANGDIEIDTKDAVLLAQHLAGWKVDVDLDGADCNGDGEVDTKDAVLLAQYLAGWKVTLG